jgi:hypothetical protein
MFRPFGTALICLAVWAQTGGKPLAFEVASIKPSRPDDSGSVIQTTGGEGLIVTNASVRSLITFAYEIRDLQLSGGPGWLGTDRFNITAKTAPDDAAFGATKQDSMTVTLGGGRRRGLRRWAAAKAAAPTAVTRGLDCSTSGRPAWRASTPPYAVDPV